MCEIGCFCRITPRSSSGQHISASLRPSCWAFGNSIEQLESILDYDAVRKEFVEVEVVVSQELQATRLLPKDDKNRHILPRIAGRSSHKWLNPWTHRSWRVYRDICCFSRPKCMLRILAGMYSCGYSCASASNIGPRLSRSRVSYRHTQHSNLNL